MSGPAPLGADSPALPAAALRPAAGRRLLLPLLLPLFSSAEFLLRSSSPDRRFPGPLQAAVLFSCLRATLGEQFGRGNGALGLSGSCEPALGRRSWGCWWRSCFRRFGRSGREGVAMYLFGSEDYEAVRCKLRLCCFLLFFFFFKRYLLLMFPVSQNLLGRFEFLSVLCFL